MTVVLRDIISYFCENQDDAAKKGNLADVYSDRAPAKKWLNPNFRLRF